MGYEENKVESYLKQRVEFHGGHCLKLSGHKGIPDRLILLPGKPAIFCELKALDGVVAPAQLIMISRLRKAGFVAETAFCKDDVDQILARALEDHDEK